MTQQTLDLALQHHAAGRLAQAGEIYQSILNDTPNNHDALHLLGVIAHQVGKHDVAVDLIGKALAIKPDFVQAHFNLGNAFRGLELPAEAAAAYGQAVRLKPDYAQAHCNLGLTLQDLADPAGAAASLRQAIDINPDFAQAHYHLGNTLKEQGHMDAALGAFRQALRIDPDHADALYNLANTQQALGQVEQAVVAYQKVLSLKPDHVDGAYNLGLAQLLLGDFEEGFDHYQLRWKTQQLSSQRRAYQQPLWQGEDFQGKTLYLYPEQGLGDFIQFSRYVRLVAARGGRVIVEVPQPLKDLYPSWASPACDDFDVHCALLDLPGIFKTRLKTIPAVADDLVVPPKLIAHWKHRLGAHKERRVGLVWGGSPGHVNDKNRSMDPALMVPLLELAGVKFFSLQIGRDGQAAEIFGPNVIDLSGEITILTKTAAAMINLDLVISVDTSLAHLAGTLGLPIWTLLPYLPDWRWMLGREDSPWYPTMKLFRQQSPGDWQGVIGRVGAALGSDHD